MQLKFSILLRLLSLRAVAGQLTSNDATLLAWRAYGNFVTDYLTAGQGLVKGVDYVYVTPPSSSAVRGGSPVPFAVQNNDLFQFANALQKPDEPLLNAFGPSYIQNLNIYVSSVDLGVDPPTDAQLAEIQKRQDAYITASNNFFNEQSIAYNRWLNDPLAQATKQPFSQWVTRNDALYISYQNAMKNAAASLQAYQRAIYGPLASILADDVNNIQLNALNMFQDVPGYNMPVFPGQYNVKFDPFNAPQLGLADGTTWRPAYSIGGSFQNVCDAWYNGTGGSGLTTTVSWTMTDYKYNDWSYLGHSTSVKQGSTGFFSFLSAKASSSSTETSFTEYTSAFNSKVTITLTMKGTPVIFNVNGGFWDVPDFRTLYPKLLPNGKDFLKGSVRLQKILVGYQVGITITFNDAAQWTSVSTFVKNAQKNVGGGISIFGFRFGAGSSSTYQQSVSSIQVIQQGNVGQIVLPPTAPGVTVMLGALGKAL
ncbi:hypothetical protein B0O99DRAFT_671946 [Bisporella sp. PMI_857]|nr:hypothetical protein B0O99DRAFT_671946 [Bisporella sp. PMI_857]